MLVDKPIVSTSKLTFVVFASDAQYAPAVQLVSLLAAVEHFEVRALKRFGVAASATSAVESLNINTVSQDVIQDYFLGAEAAFVFIMPTDLSDIIQLTRSLLEVASAAGVSRFAWVVPACPLGTELGARLAEAANLVRSSALETLWFALPAVANMMLDMGGIQYPTPFNGFYMGAEIGARNFSDTTRYNMLPVVAEKMGLDCSEMTLWKDAALLELNVAVLHSYKKHGVRMLDHHALAASFMQFVDDEQQCGRHVYGDWGRLVPPMSASTTPVYPTELENRLLKPNYFYRRDPWKTESASGKCPFHHQS